MTRRSRVIALFVACSMAAFAQSVPCTQQQSRRADEAADTLNSWDRVYDWYDKYRRCDDGGPAEGVSEAVARNLVDRWETLPRLGELARDAGFRRFVLKHLDETLNADDLKKISANASKRCPANLHSLCRDLKKRAEVP
jgi:hypothetical protein